MSGGTRMACTSIGGWLIADTPIGSRLRDVSLLAMVSEISRAAAVAFWNSAKFAEIRYAKFTDCEKFAELYFADIP